jgi:hypothetical protein
LFLIILRAVAPYYRADDQEHLRAIVSARLKRSRASEEMFLCRQSNLKRRGISEPLAFGCANGHF